MNSYPALLLAAFFAQSPMPQLPAGVQLEPCFYFEIEESFTLQGKSRTSRKAYFTAAELPWTDLGIELRNNLEEGFDAKEAAVAFQFAGKKVKGKKLTWRRNPKQSANVSAAAIHCWVLPDVDSPSFRVSLGRRLTFHLPPGCVKGEVVPHDKNAEGIDKLELKYSVPASGEYKRSTTYKLGEKKLDAHEMVFTIPAGKQKRTITYTVSKEMPGEICAMSIDGDVSGTVRVKTMTPAAPPRNLDYYPKAGFAFAPPAGYMKSAVTKQGDVVRYIKGNDFIAVKIVELGKDGLIQIKQQLLEGDKNKYGLRYGGSSRFRHLAGHKSFDAEDTKTEAPVIVTQHAGRGYLLSASALDQLTPDETREFLKGWRWIVESKMK